MALLEASSKTSSSHIYGCSKVRFGKLEKTWSLRPLISRTGQTVKSLVEHMKYYFQLDISYFPERLFKGERKAMNVIYTCIGELDMSKLN